MSQTRRIDLAILMIAAMVGLAIYAPAIRLPLFWDDVPQFRWLFSLSSLQVWYSGQISSFYRPVPFTVFKLLWHLQGGYSAPTLHLLVIALHILNAILVGLLAKRLNATPWSGPAAAALFAAFPFSYQAITWVTSIFHLALAAGVLGAAMLGLHYLETGSRAGLVSAWIAALLGIFSHENGVTLPVLASILIFVCCRQPWNRRTVAVLLPMAVLAVVYLAVWRAVPKGSDIGGGLMLAAMDAKLAYVAQALIYPLSALIRPVLADGPAVLLVLPILGVLTIGAALVALYRHSRNCLIQGLGLLAWIGVAVAPTLLLLSTPYLLGSSRLLYLSSVGIALLWVVVFDALAQSRIGNVIAVAGLAAFFLVGLIFGIQRLEMYSRVGDFYLALSQAVAAEPDTPTLLVNSPAYLAPAAGKATFLLGAEGATFLPEYIGLNDLIWVNTGVETQSRAVAFNQTLAQPPGEVLHPTEPWLDWDMLNDALAKVKVVYTSRLDGQRIRPVLVGRRADGSASVVADFGSVRLLDAVMNQDTLVLDWQVNQPPQATPFIHLICQGQLASQLDGPPLAGIHPLDRWLPGEHWLDYRPFKKPCVTLDSIRVGLVAWATASRIPATLPDGSTTDAISARLP